MDMGKHAPKMWLAVAVLVAALAAPPAASADAQVGIAVAVDDVSLGEALLIGAIGSFFGLDTKVVIGYRDRERLSFSQIVLMMYLARLAGCDQHHIAALRARGHGWGRIANDLGIHPGTFNKMRRGFNSASAGDKAFEECAFVWFVATYHGASQADILHWQSRGHSIPDIFIALDFSSKCGKGPVDLLARRSKAKSWQAVGTAAGLSEAAVKNPGKPKGGAEFRGNGGQPPAPGNAPRQPGGSGHAKGKGKHN